MSRGLGEWDSGPTEAALRADPADIPLRAAATWAVILLIRAVDDMVSALREARCEGGGGAFVDEKVGHGSSFTFRAETFEVSAEEYDAQVVEWLPQGPILRRAPLATILGRLRAFLTGWVACMAQLRFLLAQRPRYSLRLDGPRGPSSPFPRSLDY